MLYSFINIQKLEGGFNMFRQSDNVEFSKEEREFIYNIFSNKKPLKVRPLFIQGFKNWFRLRQGDVYSALFDEKK